MRTIYVKFIDPMDVMGTTEVSPKEIKKYCFRVVKYPTEAQALFAYADTVCTWSTLLEDSMSADDIERWIDEAYSRIVRGDLDWLEANFV